MGHRTGIQRRSMFSQLRRSRCGRTASQPPDQPGHAAPDRVGDQRIAEEHPGRRGNAGDTNGLALPPSDNGLFVAGPGGPGIGVGDHIEDYTTEKGAAPHYDPARRCLPEPPPQVGDQRVEENRQERVPPEPSSLVENPENEIANHEQEDGHPPGTHSQQHCSAKAYRHERSSVRKEASMRREDPIGHRQKEQW